MYNGSSPRPWGTPAGGTQLLRADRFIPTPVGNALRLCAVADCASVHPHARGERFSDASLPSINIGSSPRPWGTRKAKAIRAGSYRFIPTPVGNACHVSPQTGSASVHPHARGERRMGGDPWARLNGSSPRPWGTHFVAPHSLDHPRFIPTPVGNAVGAPCAVRTGPVHPHARGERPSSPGTMSAASGSSPRPWGTLRPKHQKGAADGSSPRPWGTHCPRPWQPAQPRFIPTPVGNAAWSPSGGRGTPVHPHARGERTTESPRVTPPCGSSPRPWGTLVWFHRRVHSQRFIPTPVGNACSSPQMVTGLTVHPHARGERMVMHGTDGHARRFIPTPVGNALLLTY